MRLGNGLWETAAFNERLQVTELGLGHSVQTNNLWKVNYTFGELDPSGNVDPAKNTGNIAKQTISFSGLAQPFEQEYKYDSLYRLTEAKEKVNSGQTINWSQNFGYDRYGNRLTHVKYLNGSLVNNTVLDHPTIDQSTNRFTSGQGYLYDKNGNLTKDAENRDFKFNGDNKQTELKDSAGNVVGEYSYDGNGKRIKKKVYGSYGAHLETVVFVYSGGKLVAEYSTKTPTSQKIKYLTEDHLGTPRVITNGLGAVESRRDFLPFGEEIGSSVGARNGSGFGYTPNGDDVRQKFTGYQKDEESQLDFAEARMYENRHGRFTAVDPLLASGNSANPQTFNRFVYVMNSPIVVTDPTGLFADYFYRDGSYAGYDDIEDGRMLWVDETRPCEGDECKTYERLCVSCTEFFDIDEISKAQDAEVARSRSDTQKLLRGGFSTNPLSEAARGLATGVPNFFINTSNLITGFAVRASDGLGGATNRTNPLAIQPFGCSGRINCNWQFASEVTTGLAPGVAAAPFRAAPLLSFGSLNPLRFSQTSASSAFQVTNASPFSGKTIGSLANELRTGDLVPRNVPVQFITRDGVDLIVNTRSSLALRRANIPTDKWNLIDVTGNSRAQSRMTQRLLNNNLTNQGTEVIRISSGSRFWSSLQ